MESISSGCITETPVERPKKQRRYYSGKKKRHTLKAQLVVDQACGKIICTAYGIGRIHDFRLLKNTKVRFHDSQLCLADKGYQESGKVLEVFKPKLEK